MTSSASAGRSSSPRPGSGRSRLGSPPRREGECGQRRDRLGEAAERCQHRVGRGAFQADTSAGNGDDSDTARLRPRPLSRERRWPHRAPGGAAGTQKGGPASPLRVDLTGAGGESAWPLAKVLRQGKVELIEDLPSRFPDLVGGGREPVRRSLALPISSNLAHRFAGVVVAGVSPHLELDASYQSFFELATAQLATAIASANAFGGRAPGCPGSAVTRSARASEHRMPQRPAPAQAGELAPGVQPDRGGARARSLRAHRCRHADGQHRQRLPIPRGARRAGADRGLPSAPGAGFRRQADVGEDRPEPRVERVQVHVRWFGHDARDSRRRSSHSWKLDGTWNHSSSGTGSRWSESVAQPMPQAPQPTHRSGW
jgi:hypothetical protein